MRATLLLLPFLASCLIPPVCGDGELAVGEECDDANTADGDGCQATCLLPICGDGVTDDNEACDDGNSTNGDPCERDCTLPTCGNNIVDATEACDDGALLNGDGCDESCQREVCGDGIVNNNNTEACDDGNVADNDGCDSNCTLPACENGVINNGEICFVVGAPILVGATPTAILASDVDGDALLDLTTTNLSANTVSVLLQTDTGLDLKTFVTAQSPTAVASAEVTGDAFVDLITVNDLPGNIAADTLNVLSGARLIDNSATFTLSTTLTAGDGPRAVITADLNGDTLTDLASLSFFSASIEPFFQVGGALTAQTPLNAGGAPRAMIAADMDGDSDQDLIVADAAADSILFFANDGAGVFTALTPILVGNGPTALSFGDVNGDLLGDLLVVETNANQARVLLNSVNGFIDAGAFAAGVSPRSLALADIENDGDLDLAIVSAGTNELLLFTNDGDAAFALLQIGTFLVGTEPTSVAAADINGDTLVDFAVTASGDNAVIIVTSAP